MTLSCFERKVRDGKFGGVRSLHCCFVWEENVDSIVCTLDIHNGNIYVYVSVE